MKNYTKENLGNDLKKAVTVAMVGGFLYWQHQEPFMIGLFLWGGLSVCVLEIIWALLDNVWHRICLGKEPSQ